MIHFFSSVGHPNHRARKHIIVPPRRHGQRGSSLYRSMKTSADTDPGSCQYRDDRQSHQTQCASQIAAYLKIPTRVNTELLHPSLNLAKSLLQDFTRLGPISRFGAQHPDILTVQRRQAQSTKQTGRGVACDCRAFSTRNRG